MVCAERFRQTIFDEPDAKVFARVAVSLTFLAQ
jgi:hypothetical protein